MTEYVAIYGDNAGMTCDSKQAAVESIIEEYGIEPSDYGNILVAEILPIEVVIAGFNIVEK